jgi:oligopeptide transport system substrate-binding protein
MQLFQTGFGMNDSGYENRKYNLLVNQAVSTIDQSRRYELYRQAEAMLNEEAPYLPIYFYASEHLVKPYVQGWKANTMDRNPSQYMYILAHQES